MRHSIFFISIVLFVLFRSVIFAQDTYTVNKTTNRGDVVWTGNTSEDWNDPANWDLNELPGIYSDITIPESPLGGRHPLINKETTAICNDLIIEQGSLLKLRGFLTVNGNLLNTDEEALVILSDETGTGSLIYSSDNVAATVQRFLTDGTQHFIGTSLDNATLEDLFFNNNPPVYFYQYVESTSDWITIADLNTPIVPGLGYSVYVSEAKSRQDVTAIFAGNLRASDLELSGGTLSYTSGSPYPGSNLISNPFSSALSWDLGNWQAENISGSIWLWNGAYNYLFRNAHGMGSLANGIIPVSQAFFIKATAVNATLTLSAADRVHSDQNFYKSAKRDTEAFIVLEVENDDKSDEVWATFCESCTEGVDLGWDTDKLYGYASAPQLYFASDEMELSIQAIPPLGDEIKTLALSFIAGESGQYSISLAQVANGGTNGEIMVLLKDLKDQTEQLLSTDSVYYFNADMNDAAERFEVHVWRGPSGINDAKLYNDYIIYADGKTVKIKPTVPSTQKSIAIQIFDVSGRLIQELKKSDNHEISIPLNVNQTMVVVRLITSDGVLNKKIYIK